MIVYIDSSVVLRMLLNEPHQLEGWQRIDQAYASGLLFVEVGRVIDRYRLLGRIGDEDVALLHESFGELASSLEIVGLTESVLARAAGPMPTVLGSLDAVHLASAIEVRRQLAPDLMLATHDEQLGRAARASGFGLLGPVG